jgi:hypothetical protein
MRFVKPLKPFLVSCVVTVTMAVGIAPSALADDTDKYEQTWTTPYSKTTCDQFTTAMNDHQRWAMAADMLTGARNTREDSGLPSDAMITEFEGGLRTACVIGSMTMTDVGVGLYMTEPRFHP